MKLIDMVHKGTLVRTEKYVDVYNFDAEVKTGRLSRTKEKWGKWQKKTLIALVRTKKVSDEPPGTICCLGIVDKIGNVWAEYSARDFDKHYKYFQCDGGMDDDGDWLLKIKGVTKL